MPCKSKKQKWPTRRIAWKMALKFQEKYGNPLQPYRCKFDGFPYHWHLTSTVTSEPPKKFLSKKKMTFKRKILFIWKVLTSNI